MIEERWVFTPTELEQVRNGIKYPPISSDDEFIATVPGGEYELGVIVLRNGTVTNRWSDGTAGVPQDVIDLVDEVETYYSEDDEEYADTWWNVIREGKHWRRAP